jgi:hypothetical protein
MLTRRATLALSLAATTLKTQAMTLDDLNTQLLGDWTSLAVELRPSAQKNADGSLKPFHLRRDFRYLAGDRFELTIHNFADPFGKVPLARIVIRGHMLWQGDHPVAPGAQKVDFIADESYEVTPLLPGFADVLNQVAAQGYDQWKPGNAQSVFGKAFAPFGLVAGKHFMEYDLVHLHHGLLFWGARHVDGRGFDTEANRPTNLQIPLALRA